MQFIDHGQFVNQTFFEFFLLSSTTCSVWFFIIIIKEVEFIIVQLLLQKNCSTCIIKDDFDICGKVKFFCFLIA